VGVHRKNDLQDAQNRRQINSDDNLRKVFGGKKNVTMFEMTSTREQAPVLSGSHARPRARDEGAQPENGAPPRRVEPAWPRAAGPGPVRAPLAWDARVPTFSRGPRARAPRRHLFLPQLVSVAASNRPPRRAAPPAPGTSSPSARAGKAPARPSGVRARSAARSGRTCAPSSGTVLIFLVIRTFLLEAFRIPSGSMIPSLLVGDWLFVNKLVYGPHIPFPT
jgi:hypothetical protein